MRKLSVLLLLLPLPVLLSGCPIWGEGTGGGGGGGDCRLDGCAVGTCDESTGRCVGGCNRDRDCGGGFVCQAGVCTPESISCRTHGDLPAGQYCNAASVPTPSSLCAGDASCQAGFWCDFRGTCVPSAGCRTSVDCAAGSTCIEGDCRVVGSDGVCQFGYQCAGTGAGLVCVDSSCTDICSERSDCLGSEDCVDGFCRPRVQQCAITSDCSGDRHCVSGRCLTDCLGAPSACSAGEACGFGDFCWRDFGASPFCTSDSECRSGHVCRDGACRTPCPTGTGEECRRFDSQLTVCATDGLCYSETETMPECIVPADCGAGGTCVDAACR